MEGVKMKVRPNYFSGVKLEPLTPEEEKLKEMIIFELENYNATLLEIENNKLILQRPGLSEEQYKNTSDEILKKSLKLQYLDNLLAPLSDFHKQILFLKYINNLKWAEVKEYLGIGGVNAQSASNIGYKIIKYLTYRANPIMFIE